MIEDKPNLREWSPLAAARRKHPKHPACPTALRRICGVCTHFDGDLSSQGGRRCTLRDLNVTAGRPAGKCKRWSRRMGPA
ncbi:MAG: hypothetical protein ACU0E9_07870 [Limimaricola soesokkakensis]|uniref:hypothetical protein n=1 Tax=Limimaricola soesokkakensis TaxID=1343159 RepID=UPI00405962B9